MRRKSFVFLMIALMAANLGPIPALAAPGGGEVGSQAADWTLGAYGGGSHTLSDYQGKVVFMFVVGYG